MDLANTHNSTPEPVDSRDRLVAQFGTEVMQQLPYEPNQEQLTLVAAMAHFLFYGGERAVFVLNGYAGTGKTSMVGGIVKALSLRGIKTVLLAPTGRAAKVFAEYSGHTAYTIHRRIYRQAGYLEAGFGLAENKQTDTLYVVDEASMISNSAGEGSIFGTGRLLDDLMHYVYNGRGCRLVLMGDAAQLPPVGQSESPALNAEVLQGYGLTVYNLHLKAIARQAAQSGILYNATILRQVMESGVLCAPRLELKRFPDIDAITGEFLLETIGDCYDRDGMNETIVVTRSNKRATMFNLGIRNSLLYREEELVSGDMLLVSKNNYYWAADYEQMDFIANGDVVRVTRVWGDIERRYGLDFANVTVQFPDHGDLEMDAKIIVDCLVSDTPGLTPAQSEALYQGVLAQYSGDKRSRYREMKKDPYFNALQVKYAYAVTCHKAQGGQWRNVFVDMGSIMPDAFATLSFYRWLYTAITRARDRVYLINCPLESDLPGQDE